MLGDQWSEAVPYIGIWGLMEVITVIFSRFCSNIYPAIGKPKISVIVQILHLIVLIPAVYIAIDYGFNTLFYVRSFVRLELVAVNMIFAYYCIKQSPFKMIKNVAPEFMGSILMSFVAYVLLKMNDGIIVQFVWIALCIIFYFAFLMIFKYERMILISMKDKFVASIIRKRIIR